MKGRRFPLNASLNTETILQFLQLGGCVCSGLQARGLLPRKSGTVDADCSGSERSPHHRDSDHSTNPIAALCCMLDAPDTRLAEQWPRSFSHPSYLSLHALCREGQLLARSCWRTSIQANSCNATCRRVSCSYSLQSTVSNTCPSGRQR